MSEFSASPERLILGALLGFAVLLFLIIKVKIQPFIAIMSSALIIGIAVGMPFSMITDTICRRRWNYLTDNRNPDWSGIYVWSNPSGIGRC